MTTTKVVRLIQAPREEVYRALLDADAVSRWLHPDGMSCRVHAFEPRVGGRVRMSLTYEDPALSDSGKSEGATDTFEGRFVELVPNERVVETVEFESADAGLRGEMRITITLADVAGGTELTWLHENVPPGVTPEDNELGARMTLDNLAALVEGSDLGWPEARGRAP